MEVPIISSVVCSLTGKNEDIGYTGTSTDTLCRTRKILDAWQERFLI
jgi:hypothetical protein